jgi:hypothetical protein
MITSPDMVPPGVVTVTWLVTARASGSRSLSGPRPGSGPKRQQGGSGAKQPEAEEGLRKSADEPQH